MSIERAKTSGLVAYFVFGFFVFLVQLMPENSIAQMETGMKKDVIVLIGASYAADWSLPAVDGVSVLNIGIGGQQSHEMLARFEKEVVDRKPRAVIIWGFINDFFRNPADKDAETEARIRQSYRRMIELAEANNIIPIIITEVTIRSEEGVLEWFRDKIGRTLGKKSYQDRINTNVRKVNQWLREISVERGLIVLDFERVLSNSVGERDARYSLADGSHISEIGYRALSDYTVPILESKLK